MKRILVFIFLFLKTLCSFAQTQYDYYDGKNSYGGVDTAISGLKIFGVIILVVVGIIIIGVIWVKLMDFINPPKQSTQQNSPVQKANKLTLETKQNGVKKETVEQERYVVLTFIGNTFDADVTMEDGSKETVRFWGNIDWITFYNQNRNFIFDIGNEIVKPAGSVPNGRCVKFEDIMMKTLKGYMCNYCLKIKGEFNPKKIQLIRVDGFGFFDKQIYYYDGEAIMQKEISDEEAEAIIANAK